ncbi:CG31730, partial [Drosophila busckii]
MCSIRELHLDDLYKFNALVFDPYTEVYNLSFFLRHFAQWPELALASISPAGALAGFIFGKCLDSGPGHQQLHGHVCVLTVHGEYRRLGLASQLMKSFDALLELRQAWYMDLFLRCSNRAAYKLYCSLGYVLRRVLLEYYPGDAMEDAFDMRKPLSRDKQRQ